MKRLLASKAEALIPAGLAALGGFLLLLWLLVKPDFGLSRRVPGTDHAPGVDAAASTNAVLAGKLTPGSGVASDLPGAWPGFRGANRTGLADEANSLARTWEAAGPRQLWKIDVGEGYAGAAVANGRVYLMDYDREHKQDALRCLSLGEGAEIWRFAYPVAVKRNHGMSRTVPTVHGSSVVAIGPKCHVVCLDATAGTLRWGFDMVPQFGATVPPWYAGQCPLFDQDKLILAPGGKDALLAALDPATGHVLWQTPNPRGWKMTHSSVVPMEFAGKRMYVYCASLGVVGVSAEDGALLWETSDWKISIATVPSPVVLEGGRIFLSGGYNAGSLMLQLHEEEGRIVARTAFKLDAEVFGATQQTPIYHQQHLYGVRPDGQFVCLDPTGKVVWTSGAGEQFGMGSFLLSDGLLFALNDSGTLRLIEATPDRYNRLAQAPVLLDGRESWGPMSLAGTRLIARDLTRMVCLEVGR
jgi:outer membrane protein assembly factor BamB